MDKDSTVNVEALLQSPGSQALDNPISLDLRELLHNSSITARSQKVRKRDHFSIGSSAEKPPRSKSRMASCGAAADVVPTEQPQGNPFSGRLTDDEERARRDRRDEIVCASSHGDASQGETFVRTFYKMTMNLPRSLFFRL